MNTRNFINKKPFLIAEISGNHRGSINNAKKLIRKAKEGGFDAVKLQTYTPEMMTLKETGYKIKTGLWKSQNLWKLYKKAQTPLNWHKSLFLYASDLGIKIFSTPFSTEAVDFLEKLNCKIYKISSFEMNDFNLVKRIAETNKPIIISTGLSTLDEIKTTLKIAKKFGAKNITLLYCVSNYPSKNLDFNLNYLEIYKNKFNCQIGLSDHSIGYLIPCMAISKGAEVIEKHICLDDVKSVDNKFSLKASDIKDFVTKLNDTFKIFSNKNFNRSYYEKKNKIFRRSIYTIKDISKGDIFTNENIKTYRPDLGLSAKYFLEIIGKKSPYSQKKNKPLSKKIINLLC